MVCLLLRVLEQATVLQVHRDPGGPERVAPELGLYAGRRRSAPNHAQRIGARHPAIGELAGFAGGGAEQGAVCLATRLPVLAAVSRISLRRASVRRKITSKGPEI
jgi:hypothetical protein